MKYWQKRNIYLFSIAKQTDFSVAELLKMPIAEHYMLIYTLMGYNKKIKEDADEAARKAKTRRTKH